MADVTLFIKSDELAVVFDDDDAKSTFHVRHTDRSPALGDVGLTDKQARGLWRVLNNRYKGKREEG